MDRYTGLRHINKMMLKDGIKHNQLVHIFYFHFEQPTESLGFPVHGHLENCLTLYQAVMTFEKEAF